MSHNGTYRGCCCGTETSPPIGCPCNQENFEYCFNLINTINSKGKLNCGCGSILYLRKKYCLDEKFCPVEVDGEIIEGLTCEYYCNDAKTTTNFSDYCNNINGSICGSACEEGTTLTYDGQQCWSGNCLDEASHDVTYYGAIIPASGSINYIQNEDNCFVGTYVYSIIDSAQNGCCGGGPSSILNSSIFNGLDETDVENNINLLDPILCDCFQCLQLLAQSLEGSNPDCPSLTCSELLDVKNNPDFPLCVGLCIGSTNVPYYTQTYKCPEKCPDNLVGGNPESFLGTPGHWFVNQNAECGCPEGYDRTYNCTCVKCTSEGGKLANCCPKEIEGFELLAWGVDSPGIFACPEWPGKLYESGNCCILPIQKPENCACWGARYSSDDGKIFVLQTNKDPWVGCVTPCQNIINCYCNLYPAEPYWFIETNPGDRFTINGNCDTPNSGCNTTICYPCQLKDSFGNVTSVKALEDGCVTNKGLPKCPPNYVYVGQDLTGSECCNG